MAQDNLRHAQYGADGIQVDDPQRVLPNATGAILAELPGSQTAADINKILVSLSSMGGGTFIFPVSEVPYVFDEEILLESLNNVTVALSPGVLITRPDPFTLTCKTVNGSAFVQVTSGTVARLKTGFYAAQYVTGTGIPLATRISTVNSLANSFTLDKNATATGEVVLTFYWAHNVFRRQGCTNVRIIAPWGRATIDGNGTNDPITFDSADSLRNCIRTAQCTDVETYGLTLRNAHYHGEIGTTNNGRIKLTNIRTERNGFRAVHYHGDSPSSAITDMFVDEIDSYEDGYKAWTIDGDQLNTGIFLVFDNTARVQMGKIRVRRVAGIGFHMTGAITAGVRSNKIDVGSLVCEDVAVPISTMNGLRAASIGSIHASGSLITLAATTLGSGTTQLPLWQSNGSAYVVGALMQSFTVPAGPDMAQFNIGQGVYIQDIASGLDVRLAIWSVNTTTRVIQVFNYSSPTTRPWPIGSDGASVTVTVWTSRGPGWYLNGDVGNLALEDITVGSAEFNTIGTRAIEVLNRGAGVRYVSGLKIAQLSVRNCYSGAYLFNCENVYLGSVTGTGSGNRRVGNDTANVGTLYMQHCINSTIGDIYAVNKGSGTLTRNGAAEVQLDSQCNNIKVMNITVANQNGSATSLQAVGTNMLLGDPRTETGVTFAPFVTGGTNVSVFRYGLV